MRKLLCFAVLAALLGVAVPAAAPAQAGVFTMDGNVALAGFMALSDGHLTRLEDTLKLEAGTGAAHSQQWARIRPLLAQIAPMNVPALLWFARRDGTYFTLQHGKEPAGLRTRAYFAQLLAGRTVLGEQVISKATNRESAVVAVPIVEHGKVVGALGASVYLDTLSDLLREQMQLPPDTIFYSFNAAALVGLNWTRSMIFLQPRKLSPELDRAWANMLAHTHGVETYTYKAQRRTVIYRKSPVTGWWYAMGFPNG